MRLYKRNEIHEVTVTDIANEIINSNIDFYSSKEDEVREKVDALGSIVTAMLELMPKDKQLEFAKKFGYEELEDGYEIS